MIQAHATVYIILPRSYPPGPSVELICDDSAAGGGTAHVTLAGPTDGIPAREVLFALHREARAAVAAHPFFEGLSLRLQTAWDRRPVYDVLLGS